MNDEDGSVLTRRREMVPKAGTAVKTATVVRAQPSWLGENRDRCISYETVHTRPYSILLSGNPRVRGKNLILVDSGIPESTIFGSSRKEYKAGSFITIHLEE